MNQPWQSLKRKNWQWRIIIWTSLFLIFGKSLGHWAYHALGIDQAYTATANLANKAGFVTMLASETEVATTPQLIIDVRNDTPNEYTIDTRISSGQLNFNGNTLSAGDIKRFIIKPNDNAVDGTSMGDIFFSSAPISGVNNSICQEIHTLNYDLKYANQIKQPLVVNLSSIASKMLCK